MNIQYVPKLVEVERNQDQDLKQYWNSMEDHVLAFLQKQEHATLKIVQVSILVRLFLF